MQARPRGGHYYTIMWPPCLGCVVSRDQASYVIAIRE